MIWTLLLMGLIGALIGWCTNLIAVKLLFRPIKAFRIPVIGWEIQGLIPKRHAEIAKSVAQTVESELLDLEMILDRMIESIDKQQVLAMLEEKLIQVIKANLPSLLQSFSGTISKYVHEMVERQGEQLLTEVTETLVHKAIKEVNLAALMESKIMEMDLVKLESVIIALAERELKQIEVLGGVLGLLIGLIQGGIVLMLQ